MDGFSGHGENRVLWFGVSLGCVVDSVGERVGGCSLRVMVIREKL